MLSREVLQNMATALTKYAGGEEQVKVVNNFIIVIVGAF